MAEPVQIAVKDTEPSAAIKTWIRERAAKRLRYTEGEGEAGLQASTVKVLV